MEQENQVIAEVCEPPKNALCSNRKGKKTGKFWKNLPFLLMLLPAIVVVFLFNYLPIYGVLIAFQDYMPGDDIFSEYTIWIGFENFERFFSDIHFFSLNHFLGSEVLVEFFLVEIPESNTRLLQGKPLVVRLMHYPCGVFVAYVGGKSRHKHQRAV